MSEQDEQGSIFLAPAETRVEEPPQPAVDGSTEAMRRLRHPFDVQPAAGAEEHNGRGSA